MFKFSLGEAKVVCWALVVLLFSALAVSDLQAQVNTAVLSGTVVDASGAVVPGVKIQAADVGTGTSYVGTTDGAGRYSLPEMPIGTYNVSAEKIGFQKMVQTGIVLTVGAHPVLDFKLVVGRIEEVVQVQGQTSSVDTSSAAVGQLVSPTQMSNLPLNGRNFTQLLTLSPGVATVPYSGGGGGQSGTAYGTQTNYSVSGSRPEGLQYLLDGTDIRDALDHGAGINITGTALGMDGIQEFTALTNTYGAQFGGTGVAINAVTKSGTNNLHGSAYEFIRNSKLDAENYFDVSGVKPPFKRNQFGGTLGGPFKKDKAFFFINYEGFRADQGQTARAVVPVTDSHPTDQTFFEANGMEAGGPTGYYGGPNTGAPGAPMNAATESIFALEPASQSLSQCPNVTNILLLPGELLSCSVGGLVQNEDYGLARVDYTFGPKDSAFARYDIENAFQSVPYSTNIISTAVLGYPEIDNERNQYTTIEERHVFSPKLLNEARFGFVRLNLLTADGGLNVTDGSTPLDTVPGRQDMSVALGGGLAGLGALPSSPSHDVMNRFSAGDDVTMTLGAHTLHFGATFTREQTNDFWLQYSGGDWIFISLQGGGPLGPLGSSFFGIPLFGLNLVGPTYSYPAPNGKSYPLNPVHAWRQNLLEPYIQDDWKISKRLTVNLGVRYEWASNPTTANGNTFVLPTADETNLGKTSIMTTAPNEGSFVPASDLFASNPNAKNIDPRIGLAFDPFADHKTSIRAGFAMYHEPVTSRTYTFLAPNPTEPTTETFFPGIIPGQITFPNEEANFAAATSPVNAPGIVWFYGLFPTVDRSPYMMQYNLTVQRQLLPGTVFNIGYNGSTGVHLFAWINGNPSLYLSNDPNEAADMTSGEYTTPGGANPTGTGAPGTVNNPFIGVHENGNFGSFMATEPFAHSSYNSLQTSLTRQFAANLAGNAAYTWSKCLDNASATVSSEQGEYAIIDAYNPALDRGPCSFSSNQVFTANAVYNLPFHGNRAINGWQVSPIFSYFRGLPINVQTYIGLYQSNIAGATEGERPNLVPGCKPMVRSVHEWYNPECYVLPPFGTLGNVGRDSINNPNYFDWDFALVKNTKLTEQLNMELRAEFFDIVNHPNFIVGPQVLNWSVAAQINPTNPNYSLLSTPSAYVQPTATTPGGALCNPSGLSENNGGSPAQVCYTSSTALGTTVPGNLGSQREIQFAVKFQF
jgi:hypothetical protein